jgi:hypothetical protein
VGDPGDPVAHRPLGGLPFLARGGDGQVPAADGRHVTEYQHRGRHEQQPRDQRNLADPSLVVTGQADHRDHHRERDARDGEHRQQPLPGRYEPPPARRP